jgi:4'-phosphopantetheinyl transferase
VNPEPGEVHVWALALGSAERGRDARLATADTRRRLELRRAGLLRVLAGYLGVRPDEVVVDRTCARCGDPEHGKPRVPGGSLEFSTAATRDIAVVAVTSGGRLGVDVEPAGAVEGALAGGLPATLFTDGERRAVADGALTLETLWLRKEALSKAIGTGLVAEVATLDIQTPGGEWHFHDLPDIHGCRGALASEDPVSSVQIREA